MICAYTTVTEEREHIEATAAGHSSRSSQKLSLNSDNPLHSGSIDHSGGSGGDKGSNVIGHSLSSNKRPSSKSHSSGSKGSNYTMVSMFSHDGPKGAASDHRRSMSPRPSSLTPSKGMKQLPQQRSPSPSPTPGK